MSKFLDYTGLAYFWQKIKTYVNGLFPENAVFTDTTYSLSQDSQDGHKLIFTPSEGTAVEITIPDSDTTYSEATSSQAGLMSASDKALFDQLLTRITALETMIYTIDPNDPYSDIYPLSLRVANLEEHALMDSGMTVKQLLYSVSDGMDPGAVINSSNKWALYTNQQKSCVIKIPTGSTSVSYTPVSGSVTALLSAYETPTSGGTPSFATNHSGRKNHSSAARVTIDLTETDAGYLYSSITGGSGNDISISNIIFTIDVAYVLPAYDGTVV